MLCLYATNVSELREIFEILNKTRSVVTVVMALQRLSPVSCRTVFLRITAQKTQQEMKIQFKVVAHCTPLILAYFAIHY